MQIADILVPERTLCHVDSCDKQSALALLARLLASADPNLTDTAILECLLRRESQGSTGFGKGWALPHGRLPQCTRPIAACVRLRTAVEFAALDGRPVQLLFAILAPETAAREHLQILARLAEIFSNETTLQQLHSASSSAKIYQILTS